MKILNNSRLKSPTAIGIVMGAAIGLVISVIQPFTTALLQPVARQLLGRTPKQVEEPKPAPKQGPAPASTTIYNFNFYGEKSPAPKVPSRMPKKKFQYRRIQPR
jgi:hypothetical protein